MSVPYAVFVKSFTDKVKAKAFVKISRIFAHEEIEVPNPVVKQAIALVKAMPKFDGGSHFVIAIN